jgi:hypothetical protein
LEFLSIAADIESLNRDERQFIKSVCTSFNFLYRIEAKREDGANVGCPATVYGTITFVDSPGVPFGSMGIRVEEVDFDDPPTVYVIERATARPAAK